MATIRIKEGEAEYTHLDHQGTPVARSSNGNGGLGAVTWREHYTPFGEKTLAASANADNVGYTGHVQDDWSGLTYMQARYYDPVLGRFLSTDPIGYRDQLNLYAYVRNDPVNMVDPDGRQAAFFHPLGRHEGKTLEQAAGDEVAVHAPMITITLLAVEAAMIGADIAAGGPTGEGIAPSRAVAGAREYVGSLAGKGIREVGEYGENRAAQEIVGEGGELLARQEPLSTGSRGDIIYRDADGATVCCEVKAGRTAETAPLSPRQAQTKSAVEANTTVTTSTGRQIDRYEERRYPIDY